jgi:hypothetical protein
LPFPGINYFLRCPLIIDFQNVAIDFHLFSNRTKMDKSTGIGRPNAAEGGLNAELVEKWGLPKK